MNKTHLVFTIIIIVATILMPACRSTKHTTGTQTQTTSISQMEIDSATSRLMTIHRKNTSITVLPMQTPALPPNTNARCPSTRPGSHYPTPAAGRRNHHHPRGGHPD